MTNSTANIPRNAAADEGTSTAATATRPAPDETLDTAGMTYDEALAFLDRVACGLAQTLGPFCEAIVQDATDEGLVVRSIYNGHVSGRAVGSTLSVYGCDTSRDDPANRELDFEADSVGLLATAPDGRHVKSSTWTLHGPGYVLDLGINLDITAVGQASAVLAGLSQVGGELREQMRSQPAAPQEAQGVLDAELARLGKPAEALSRDERVRLVRALRTAGFFDFQKSVPLVARRLGVSKCSIYNYLRE